MTSAQWNTDADGPEKRELADRLAERLRRDVRRAAGSCTAARASGTRASRCPAGTSRSSGAPTACRSGRTRRCFADPWGEADDPDGAAERRGAGPRGHPVLGLPEEQLLPGLRGPVRGARRRGPRPEGARPASRRPRRRGRCRQARRASPSRPAGCCRSPPPRRAGPARAWRFRRGRLVLTPRHERGRAAAAAGLDRVGGPGARRRAVVPRGRTAAASPSVPAVTVVDPEGAPHHRAGVRGARRPRARVPARRPSGSRTTPTCSGWSRSAARADAGARWCSRATARRPTRALTQLVVTPDPGVIEVNVQPTATLGRAARPDHDAVRRRRAPSRADDREVRPRRAAHRHRRRQPPHPRRPAAGRLAAAAPARPAGQPGHLLAAAPVAVLPVLRAVHRPDQPGAALRRGPARGGLRDGDRARGDRPAHRDAERPGTSPGRGWSTARCGTCSPT